MFRKHLGWYIEQAPWPADPLERRAAKARLCRLETPEEVETALTDLWLGVTHLSNFDVENRTQVFEAVA
jgi:tRNA-dihydrouridine synthase